MCILLRIYFRFGKKTGIGYCTSAVNLEHTFMHKISDSNDFFSKFEANVNLHNLSNVKEGLSLRKESAAAASLELLESLLKDENVNINKNEQIKQLLFSIPNDIHPTVQQATENTVIKTVGRGEPADVNAHSYDILKSKDLFRINNLKRHCGDKSYYLIGLLAKLEWSLIELSLKTMMKNGFRLISVPDILSSKIVESCGMSTTSKRTQIYKLSSKKYGSGWCLSGTSEIGLAAYLMEKNISVEKIPLKLTSVSRCYRAEISELATEKGLYRVHEFNKVEMFSVCLPSQSEEMLESFREFQEQFFSSLGFHYKVIDMGIHELGRQAYRKYDIEVWMPGYNKYGEISSCSNCTDYQTRRLNIRSGNVYLHSINATACAVPRTIIAIAESYVTEKLRITVPSVLQPYIGTDIIGMKRGPKLIPVNYLPKSVSNEYIQI